MLESLKSFTLNELFDRLHRSIKAFVGSMSKINEMNSTISENDIAQLREHIKQRLTKNEDTDDNGKMLKLIDLFSTDKAVMELIKSDAEEWVEFLDAMKENLDKTSEGATKTELIEINKIKKDIDQLKFTIRKEQG